MSTQRRARFGAGPASTGANSPGRARSAAARSPRSIWRNTWRAWPGKRSTISSRSRSATVSPVNSRTNRTVNAVYGGSEGPGGDIYSKGSLIAHTLRMTLGDDDFFEMLRLHTDSVSGTIANHSKGLVSKELGLADCCAQSCTGWKCHCA